MYWYSIAAQQCSAAAAAAAVVRVVRGRVGLGDTIGSDEKAFEFTTHLRTVRQRNGRLQRTCTPAQTRRSRRRSFSTPLRVACEQLTGSTAHCQVSVSPRIALRPCNVANLHGTPHCVLSEIGTHTDHVPCCTWYPAPCTCLPPDIGHASPP